MERRAGWPAGSGAPRASTTGQDPSDDPRNPPRCQPLPGPGPPRLESQMSRARVNFRGLLKRVSAKDGRRQKNTLARILQRLRVQPGVVLADEVGMGKTYIALGAIAEYLVRYRSSRVLVLTPSSDLAEKW